MLTMFGFRPGCSIFFQEQWTLIRQYTTMCGVGSNYILQGQTPSNGQAPFGGRLWENPKPRKQSAKACRIAETRLRIDSCDRRFSKPRMGIGIKFPIPTIAYLYVCC